MILLFFISIGLSIGYIFLLQWITEGWEVFIPYKGGNPSTKVSIIIAARNEEANIVNCLSSIYKNKYPQDLLEIIVVDDQSQDRTAAIVKEQFPQVTLLYTIKNQGKKAAIQLAANRAQGELLMFTDADCIVPEKWLDTLVSNYNPELVNFIAAPVQIDLEDTNLSRFQYLDVAATMAVTANGILRKSYYSANGANMAVNRKIFLELYSSRLDGEIASGDDMFTIQYLAKQDPSKITFVRSLDATVTTKGEETLSDLLSQRKRWAGKSRHYPEKNIVLVQGYVFLLVALMLFNLVFGFLTNGTAVFIAVLMLFIKITMDYLFLSHLCKHNRKEEATKKYIISAAFYNLYILFAGLVAMFPRKYDWKGRSLN